MRTEEKWNISATDEQKWNPFFASEAFLELGGHVKKKANIMSFFPLFLSFFKTVIFTLDMDILTITMVTHDSRMVF